MKKLHKIIRSSKQPTKIAKFLVPHKGELKSLFMLTTLRDGSLVINAGGYFKDGNWRWGHFDFPPQRNGKTNVTMLPETKLHHLEGLGPKITYHRSGIVTTRLEPHISDQGIPRVQGTPVAEISGHFFTIMAKGFNAFKRASTKKKYTNIPIRGYESLDSIKVVGYMGELEDLLPDKEITDETAADLQLIIEKKNGFTVQTHLFNIILNGKVRWLKIQLWPNFPYNPNNQSPSFSMLTGWREEEMKNQELTVRALGILAGT